jgi:predicted metal-dependent hydrolase
MPAARIPHPVYSVRLQGQIVEYTIRRSPRAKHIRISISAHEGVVVTFPARMRRYVNPDDFLREKQDWVLRHVEKFSPSSPRSTELTSGSRVSLYGREYTVAIQNCTVRRPQIELTDVELRVQLPVDYSGEVKDAVKSWIRSQAVDVIQREAARMAAQIGVEYRRITIRDQRTKWGSCSRNGNLSFNWRLILFPPDVLRYVVIHELCHLKQFNHSPRFWQLVERFDPSFRRSIEWLKTNGVEIEGALR